MDRPEKAMVLGDAESAYGGRDSTLRTFDSGRAVERGRRRLIGQRSWGSGEYQQRHDYKTQENVRAVVLIPC